MVRRIVWLLLPAVLPSVGCYNYLPRGRTELEPAMYVDVRLTRDGSDSLSQYLGPEIVSVRGIYQMKTETGLKLSVWQVAGRQGEVLQWRGESVIVPEIYVNSIQQRRSAGFKTALLSGVFLSGFFVAAHAFGSSATGSGMFNGTGTGKH
ncbi:MAG TPA: hypothetical protein VKB45_13730 [Gemmatimonadales bacterium]|nr:hypothetical protein [Gemmatimonadales bacterium]